MEKEKEQKNKRDNSKKQRQTAEQNKYGYCEVTTLNRFDI